MKYQVIITPMAEKQIRKLPRPAQERILGALTLLSENPRPVGCKKLEGEANHYRVRVDDYRIIYRIQDQEFIVITLKVAHRREVYRKR